MRVGGERERCARSIAAVHGAGEKKVLVEESAPENACSIAARIESRAGRAIVDRVVVREHVAEQVDGLVGVRARTQLMRVPDEVNGVAGHEELGRIEQPEQEELAVAVERMLEELVVGKVRQRDLIVKVFLTCARGF